VHVLSVFSMGFLALFLAGVLALVVADVGYTDLKTIAGLFRSREVLAAMRLTAITSLLTLVFVVLFALPVGYALSRYRFPGHALADTVVDLPIVLPPVVIGVSLLVFFTTTPGKWFESLGFRTHSVAAIVLCQFFVSVSYAIRSAKAAFDSVDQRLENAALTLGCTRAQAFRMVTLPIARDGLIAGAIMAWARAVGVFAPLMVFVGSIRMKTEVMPTTVYLGACRDIRICRL
jgi:molybdate transport system permease protein